LPLLGIILSGAVLALVAPQARYAGPFGFCGQLRIALALQSRDSAAASGDGPQTEAPVTQGGHISTEPRINERIRVPEVRLVGPAGEQVGIVAINDALRLAQEADLDLVEVAPMARPPVAKLMDYGKFKYESALKARESRKNQAQTVIKEIKLRPKIDPHDYGTKKGHVERFLKQGDKVKVTIMFRGREQSRPELGFKLLQRLAGDIEELGFVESSPKQDGRNMIMVIGPHKRKTDAMAAARADRAERAERPTRSSARAAESAAHAAEQAAPDQEAPSAPPAEQAVSAEQATAAEQGVTAEQADATEQAAAADQTAASQPAEQEAPAAKPTTGADAPPKAAAPRPAAPRPTASARPAAPKPSAPRAAPGSAARPGPSGGAAPKPTAPRGTTAAARPAASSSAAPKPGPARRSGDGSVSSSRSAPAEGGGTANESGEAGS
jgi:translation initiation factor IF-3